MLTQGSMTVDQYTERFHALGRYMPSTMENERAKMLKLKTRLNSRIQSLIICAKPRTFEDFLEICREVENDLEKVTAEDKGKRPREDIQTGRSGRWLKVAPATRPDDHSGRSNRDRDRLCSC